MSQAWTLIILFTKGSKFCLNWKNNDLVKSEFKKRKIN